MIKLRLVGPSADLQHLVYTSRKTGKKGSHLVNVDEKLFDVLEDLVRRRRRAGREGDDKPAAPRKAVPQVQSKLAPRDVQRLLRAGRTVDQVARTAGAPVSWVEQFLVPVLYDRQGMVREARRVRLEKAKLGMSGLPLGESVQVNLRSRHVRLTDQEFEDAWDATRQEGQPWVVVLRFRFRGREQKAIWRYDPARRQVTAGNRLAADLGWVAPGRKLERLPRGAAAVTTAARPRAKRTVSRARPKKKAATRKRATKKKAAPRKRATRRPAARKRTTRRPAARRRTTTARRTRRR